MKNTKNSQILRRSFLAGLGTGAAASFINPLIAQAQSATGAPQRLLMIHRPCGTDMNNWFPTGGTSTAVNATTTSTTGWKPSALLSSFSALQNDMVVIKGLDCPRQQGWLGDKHGAGMLAMTSPPPKDKGPSDRHNWPVLPGYTQSQQDDTNAKFFTATDMSIDQLYLNKIAGLKGALIPSVQLTSSTESADSKADSCLRVVSYSKPDASAANPTSLWPEVRPDVAFKNIFGSVMMNLDAAKLARTQAQNKSILDYIVGDLGSLKTRVPSSQLSKVDQHLAAVRALETNLSSIGTGRMCIPPTVSALPAAMNGMPTYDATHYQSSLGMMKVIKTMFECDLTRVASFTFGWGNSSMHFFDIMKQVAAADLVKDTKGNSIVDTGGHHDISHNGGTGFVDAQYIIDKFYCNIVANMLNDMKATPDGAAGGSLLDNTLVVFWNECSIGNPHDVIDMPVALFGGKFLKLQGGRYLQYGKDKADPTAKRDENNFTNNRDTRTMSDFWVQTSQQWGYKDMTYYSAFPNDPMWNKGTMPGIYG